MLPRQRRMVDGAGLGAPRVERRDRLLALRLLHGEAHAVLAGGLADHDHVGRRVADGAKDRARDARDAHLARARARVCASHRAHSYASGLAALGRLSEALPQLPWQ